MMRIMRCSSVHSSGARKLIERILEGEFKYRAKKRPDIIDIKGFYQKGKGNFWVAIGDGRVVGTIAIKDYGRNRGYLKRMFIDKEFRGSGLAQKMLRHALSHAKSKGFSAVYLATVKKMKAAIRFYEKNGFRRIERLPRDLPDFGDTEFYIMRL